MLPGMESASTPLFSVVSAVYNVERYLPEFIASIEAQDFDLGRVEVIVVDDGSTDGSAAAAEGVGRPPARAGAGGLAGQRRPGRGPQPGHGARPRHVGHLPRPRRRRRPQLPLDRRGLRREPTPPPTWSPPTAGSGTTSAGELLNDHPLETLLPLRPAGRPRGLRRPLPRQLARRLLPARPDPRARPPLRRPDPAELRGRPLLLAATCSHSERPQVGFLQSTRYHYRKRSDQSSSLRLEHDPPRPLHRRLRATATSRSCATPWRLRGSGPGLAQALHLLRDRRVLRRRAEQLRWPCSTDGPVVERVPRARARQCSRRSTRDDAVATTSTGSPATPGWSRMHGYRDGAVARPGGVPRQARHRPAAGPGALPLHRSGARRGDQQRRRPEPPAARQDPRPQLLRPDPAARADPLAALPPRPADPARRRRGPKLVFDQPEPAHADQGHADHGPRATWSRSGASPFNPMRYVPTTRPGQGAPPARAVADRCARSTPTQLGADGPHPRRRRQRRDPVQAPPRAPPRHQRVVRAREGRRRTASACARRGTATGWSPHGSRAVAAADGQLRAPARPRTPTRRS